MVSLYCGLNVLFDVVKRTSIVLLSQFYMIAICFACGMLYNLKILFFSSLKFLSSLYLSSVSQLNVGCFLMGPPSLGPAFCVLSALTIAMTYIVALVASATACTIASLVLVCSLAIVCKCTLSAYVSLYETLFLTPCYVSCLNEDNTGWCLYAYLLLFCEYKSECVFTCVQDYIYSDRPKSIQRNSYLSLWVLNIVRSELGWSVIQNPCSIFFYSLTNSRPNFPAWLGVSYCCTSVLSCWAIVYHWRQVVVQASGEGIHGSDIELCMVVVYSVRGILQSGMLKL